MIRTRRVIVIPEDTDVLIGRPMAAKILNVSAEQVKKLTDAGVIPHVLVGRRAKYKLSEVLSAQVAGLRLP